jgi:hypothetical protein
MKRYLIYAVNHLGWSGDVGYVPAKNGREAMKIARKRLSKAFTKIYGAERCSLAELRGNLHYYRPLQA